MTQKKLFASLLSLSTLLIFTGCSTNNTYTDPGLIRVANSANRSLTELKATEQAANPPVSISEPPNPATYGMAMPVSIDWNGPVEPVVHQIANMTNYKVRIVGQTPSIPVIVNISTYHKPVGEVLRDVGYQCGNKAQIVVFPSTHVIEIRYLSA